MGTPHFPRTAFYPVEFLCFFAIAPTSAIRQEAGGRKNIACSLWNLDTGERLHKLEGNPEEVHSLAFSPDGQFLASSGLDHNIHLWDLSTGKRCHTLKGHLDYVNEVAISPDGQTLISGSCDRTIKVWGIN